MAKVDLSKISTVRLEMELNKRVSDVQKKQEMEQAAKRIQKWRQRPSCKFVGKAYGPSTSVEEVVLARVFVEGSAGWEYKPAIKVPRAVSAYFHNNWANNLRSDFQWMLKTLVDYFIDTKIETDLITVLQIIRDASHGLYDHDKNIREEWEQSVVEKLSEFPLTELEKHKKGKSRYQPWEYRILKATIKYKIEKNIPDAQKPQLLQMPPEYKTALAIGKMGNSDQWTGIK